MKLGKQVGLGPGSPPNTLCYVGTQLPLPQKGTAPQFSAHICCGQMAAWINMSLGMDVGLGPGDFVLDGDPAPPPQKGGGQSPRPAKFSAHVYCGQTAGWMKLVFGMEVGLSPDDFVLDGDPVPFHKRGWSPLPNFWPISIVAKRLHASKCNLV